MNKDIFYFKPIIESIFDMLGITVSIWKKNDFESIFTSNDVMNIQYGIREGFGDRERVYYIDVNNHFGPRRTNIKYAIPNYVPVNI